MINALNGRRAATFGFGAAMLSGAGQTYFIGLFGDALRGALGLSETALGLLFGLSTLASGALMFWIGAVADRLQLKYAVALAAACLGLGAAVMAAATGPVLLLLAFFLLRLGGQGLCGHLAVVAVARHVEVRRGRALSITVFGFIVGEAIWPQVLAAALGVLDWRTLWLLVAVAVVTLGLPALYALAAPLPAPPIRQSGAPAPLRRRSLMGSVRFVAPLGIVLVPPFLVTAVFFHQSSVAALKGWDPRAMAPAFAVFALAQALANWLSGRAVDRIGALALMRVQLWPIALAMLAVALLPASAGPWALFALLGAGLGANGVIAGALWPDLFGTTQLGLVRGVYASMMIAATALAPPLAGYALTSATPLALLVSPIALYAAVAPWLLVGRVSRSLQRTPPMPG